MPPPIQYVPKSQSKTNVQLNVGFTIQDFLGLAYLQATESPDRSTQLGAIIVDPRTNNILASQPNRFPEDVIENAERWKSPEKYFWVEHAERGAIFEAAREGRATKGTVMYCPWFACTECARAICRAGIKKVIGHHDLFEIAMQHNPKWIESVERGNTILDESGVQREYYRGKIGPTPNLRVNGKPYSPSIIFAGQTINP